MHAAHRLAHRLLLSVGLLALVASTGALAGCGDADPQVSCTDSAACLTMAGTLFVGDSSPDSFPVCCGGFCVLPSGGCDTGFRYLTAEPAYGVCAPASVCPAVPQPDLAMSVDLSVSADAAVSIDLADQD